MATHKDHKRALSAVTEDKVKYFDEVQLRAMLNNSINDDNIADVIEAGNGEITGHSLGEHNIDTDDGGSTETTKPTKSADYGVEPTEVIVAQHDADRQLRGVSWAQGQGG